MSLIKTNETPQTLASFTTAFTQVVNNLWGQSRGDLVRRLDCLRLKLEQTGRRGDIGSATAS
jgi:hypothetical protein